MFRCTNATTERCAQDHRAAEPAAGTIAQAAGVIDHLVDAGVNESHKLDFSNRAHTLCRQPDTHAGYGGFSKWGVQYALLTKALQESIGGPEHAAINAYILAAFDAGGGNVWNAEQSSRFDLGPGQRETITLNLTAPRVEHTRLVVQLVHDGYAVDESYSQWFDTH